MGESLSLDVAPKRRGDVFTFHGVLIKGYLTLCQSKPSSPADKSVLWDRVLFLPLAASYPLELQESLRAALCSTLCIRRMSVSISHRLIISIVKGKMTVCLRSQSLVVFTELNIESWNHRIIESLRLEKTSKSSGPTFSPSPLHGIFHYTVFYSKSIILFNHTCNNNLR